MTQSFPEVESYSFFDEANSVAISDATKYNQSKWELHNITLTGLEKDVSEGEHKIEVRAAVDKGKLRIPHYNADSIEATLTPPIFANLHMLGFY